jgi:L-fuconolactonase
VNSIQTEANARNNAHHPPDLAWLSLRQEEVTEFINGMAAIFESGNDGEVRACAGIVGFADLLRGDSIKGVLEAHVAAGGGRFRGIRNIVA